MERQGEIHMMQLTIHRKRDRQLAKVSHRVPDCVRASGLSRPLIEY